MAFLRPDRSLMDYDRWKPLDDEQIKVINRSQALIITGGPSLRPDLYPHTFPLVPDLSRILVPILTLGVGWNHSRGSWHDTHHYGFTRQSIRLLDRIAEAPYYSGVRDYHTLNVTNRQGYSNFMMTGCPALYDLSKLNENVHIPPSVQKIAFSLGTRFLHSTEMENNTKRIIAALMKRFDHADLTIVFHHSIDPLHYTNHQAPILKKQLKMLEWVKSKKLSYVDISGSAQKLIEFYEQVDLHIGYRVHAHIFCSSISKPSVLIAEDGRGLALQKLNIGLILPGFLKFRYGRSVPEKIVNRLRGKYEVDAFLPDDVINNIDYEIRQGFPRLSQTRSAIDELFPIMERYIQQLP